MKIDKHLFKSIETKVYNYKKIKREIKMLELDIIDGGDRSADEIGSGKNSVRTITDMTAIKANTLIEDRRLSRMKQDTKAIESVFNSLLEEKQDLISLYYWEQPNKYTWVGVAGEMNTSRGKGIRWRNQFIKEETKGMGENLIK